MKELKFVKLLEKMKEYRYNQRLLAQELNLTPAAMSARMNGHTAWRLTEMCKIMDLLKIPYSQIKGYFN